MIFSPKILMARFFHARGTYVLLLRKSTSTVQGVTAIKPFPPVVLFQYKSLKRN